jgi:hypothetical protein
MQTVGLSKYCLNFRKSLIFQLINVSEMMYIPHNPVKPESLL